MTPSYSKQRVKVVGEPFYLSDNLQVQEKERGKRGGKLEKKLNPGADFSQAKLINLEVTSRSPFHFNF